MSTTLRTIAGRLRDRPDIVGIAGLTLASLLVLWLQPVDPNAGVSRGSDVLAVAFVLATMVPLLWSRRAPLAVAVVAGVRVADRIDAGLRVGVDLDRGVRCARVGRVFH